MESSRRRQETGCAGYRDRRTLTSEVSGGGPGTSARLFGASLEGRPFRAALIARLEVEAMATTIGIFVFDGVEELDWVGPWEVLRAWSLAHPDDGVEVFSVARNEGVVECAKGMRVLPDHTWDTAPAMDVVIVPGGRGTRPQIGDPDIRRWVTSLAEGGTLMTSVCTGSLVLADSGLLDNGPATTHWGSLEHLAALGTDVEVRADDRFVDRGDIITASGVSAGIDMALHLIARLHTVERAREVRRYIQYDPEPPV
jgi:transcriptional regulator GlxA family with amidase domain